MTFITIPLNNMRMRITHNFDNHVIETTISGHTAYVNYEIVDGNFDVRRTFVPATLEGQGVASKLVQYAYDYARSNGLHPVATCSYAVAWLQRHPQA